MLDNIISALAGAVVGGIITYIGSVKISQRNITSHGAMKLISAFNNELAILTNPDNSSVDVYPVISNAFQKHLAAVIEFRSYLSQCDRPRLDKAWKEYHCHEETGLPFLEQYAPEGSVDNRKQINNLAVSRINNIIKFAEKYL